MIMLHIKLLSNLVTWQPHFVASFHQFNIFHTLYLLSAIDEQSVRWQSLIRARNCPKHFLHKVLIEKQVCLCKSLGAVFITFEGLLLFFPMSRNVNNFYLNIVLSNLISVGTCSFYFFSLTTIYYLCRGYVLLVYYKILKYIQ